MSEEKKSLMELTHGYLSLLDSAYELEMAGEDVPSVMQDEISNMLTKQAEKVDNCASLVSRCKHEQEWLKNEKKRIDIEINKMEYIQNKIKYLAVQAMDAEGITKLSGKKGHYFSKRKSSAVEIINLHALDSKFITTTVTEIPDKKKIKDHLKAGELVPGALLKTNFSVTIK